jgi:hypothetical protein
VSDFLTRVASRAVGQSASAQPRLPALFERAEPAGAMVESEETPIAAPPSRPAASEREAPRPVGPPREEVPVERQAAAPRAPVPEAAPPVGPPPPWPAPEPALRETVVVTSPPATRIVRETVGERETPVEAAAAVRAEPVSPAPAVIAAPAVAARPAAAEADPPAPAAEARARAEAPAVRVHIGRLEVRASLHEAPAPERPAGRERPEPDGLSLADYLRGERAAR